MFVSPFDATGTAVQDEAPWHIEVKQTLQKHQVSMLCVPVELTVQKAHAASAWACSQCACLISVN
jgi:hypothetical protein